LLLPIFFVINKYVQFAGLLNRGETIVVLVKISVIFFAIFFLAFFFIKNYLKAGVIVTYLGSVYLFFGDIKPLIMKTSVLHYISSYRILFPLLFIFSLFFIYRIIKWKQLNRITLFLNIVLLIYIGIEAYKWVLIQRKSSIVSKKSSVNYNLSSTNRSSLKPINIYYIILDCYPSASYQEDQLGIKDHVLDSNLLAKGFFVLTHPRNNYAKTAFSMAATFDMNYLPWLDTILTLPYEYNKAIGLVKNSPVFHLLNKEGYQIYNLSTFDLPGKPPCTKKSFSALQLPR
jgi:hypothetical protein